MEQGYRMNTLNRQTISSISRHVADDGLGPTGCSERPVECTRPLFYAEGAGKPNWAYGPSETIVDTFSAAKRSEVMSRVRHTKTAPEVVVASMLRYLGVRFRRNVSHLPGQPDFVLNGCKSVVLVHGCFWHRHPGCKKSATPRTNVAFWLSKFDGNVRRDRRNARLLRQGGWQVVTVWECNLSKPERVLSRLRRLLSY
jgi:DNA mismatch endonuclease (patch repair protein)